jgi:basic amino acid/polyamine antiporter, APA family
MTSSGASGPAGPPLSTGAAPSRLARTLGLRDATVIGLGSMIGSGVFVAFGPAARAAGSGLMIGLALAALVAYCNATSTADLAAVHPSSGGAYVYGNERLSPFLGHLAGWSFIVGKNASCAAMALTLGAYGDPRFQRPLGLLAVAALVFVNYLGVSKTAALTRAILAVVLTTLAIVVIVSLAGGSTSTAKLGAIGESGLRGILQSAGVLFFAFAGYARIATLGEEVIEPAVIIPQAIRRALGITLLVYVLVAVSALMTVGPNDLGGSSAPLVDAVRSAGRPGLAPVVRVGGIIASTGVLLSLLAGISRTTFAMAADRRLPHQLALVHGTRRIPHRAVLLTGATVAALVATTDLRNAIGFSSFAVLVYYAVANAAALTLPNPSRWQRARRVGGLSGCALLACMLPGQSVMVGAAVVLVGAAVGVATRQ